MSEIWVSFNLNSGAVQAISTIVLVVITAIYAFQTKKTSDQMKETNELMSMQIFPKIFIEPEKLCSFLLSPSRIEKIKENISKTEHGIWNFPFLLNYKVSNHSASSGSIERPQLLIENPISRKKKLLLPDTRNAVQNASYKGEVSNTIYLKAGEMKNMEDEEFCLEIFADNLSDDDMDFINNASLLQYTVLYKNIIGQQFSVKLTKEQVLPPEH